MKKIIFICLLFSLKLFSGNTDSLIKLLLKQNLPDTQRVKILSRLSVDYEFSNDLPNAEKYAKLYYALALKVKNYIGIGDYYNYIGRKFYYKQFYDSAIINFGRAAKQFEEINFNRGIASAGNNIASIYSEKGDIKKSIIEHRWLMGFNKKNKDTTSLSASYSNLGLCFMNIFENDSAIHYITLSSRINEKANNNNALQSNYFNLATINYNIGQSKKALFYLNLLFSLSEKMPLKPNFLNLIYALKANICHDFGNIDSADFYVSKTIVSSLESGDKMTLIDALNHQARLYIIKNNLSGASISIQESIRLSKEIESDFLLSKSYEIYGHILMKEKKYKEASKYYNMSFDIAIKSNSSDQIIEDLKGLANSHALTGEFKQSALYLDSIIKYKDRLNQEEEFKNIKEIEAQFETEKKDILILKSNSDLKASEAESKRKSIILISGSIALFVTLFLAVIAIVNFRKAQKAKQIVQSQNKTLEQKNHEVELQKNLVLEKQNEIISSINYAQRIQSAVLTGEDVWKKISKEYFILFKPKDIVSGDFYWAHVLPNGRAVFALADCTGHGVPGGFMSMLGNSFLNELVVENKIFNAATLLNKLRDKVIKALDQKGQRQQQDGMDIVLCVWNKMENTLEFAGANNNLYLVRENKMNEFKGNKMPIGTFINDKILFTSQIIQLQKGDCIYVTTDGFADQFGGTKGKKYKYKQLEEVLETINDMPMDIQSEILEKELIEWKGQLEQVDDICVIGIRV